MLNLDMELDTRKPYGFQRTTARALAAKPEIILLDEPVAGCNDQETAELKSTIQRSTAIWGHGLLVEHDMSMVMSVAITLRYQFRANLAEGTPAEIKSILT